MKSLKIALSVALVMIASASTANAGLIVTGMETVPGTGIYSFSFSQDGTVQGLQSRDLSELRFQILLPGSVFGTTAGNITDGTTLLSPFPDGSWRDAATTASSINPNLITSANSGPIMLAGAPNIDFSVTNVTWQFGSVQLLSGVVQAAPTNPTPEPTSLAIFGIGVLGLMVVRRRKSKLA